MPPLDLSKAVLRTGTIYPPPLDAEVKGRASLRLGDLGGLTQFGANLVILAPGAKSSLRHWHEVEDEFVMVTEGTITLVDNHGEHLMRPGDCAAFPAGSDNAHCFVNRTAAEARFLVVGTRSKAEVAHYPDLGIQVRIAAGNAGFFHEDGRPWTPEAR
jgi:uncharacterized cupin superfamily protein